MSNVTYEMQNDHIDNHQAFYNKQFPPLIVECAVDTNIKDISHEYGTCPPKHCFLHYQLIKINLYFHGWRPPMIYVAAFPTIWVFRDESTSCTVQKRPRWQRRKLMFRFFFFSNQLLANNGDDNTVVKKNTWGLSVAVLCASPIHFHGSFYNYR